LAAAEAQQLLVSEEQARRAKPKKKAES